MARIHHVNHPGQELRINYSWRKRCKGRYVFARGSKTEGICFWNKGFIDGKEIPHLRKFMEHPGAFVDSLPGRNGHVCGSTAEKRGRLRFWGEYEGHSDFSLLRRDGSKRDRDLPRAVHRPFFCRESMNDQNTDPYVFGGCFYYVGCKKDSLKEINVGDLVLFGSEFGPKGDAKFHLDTLMVVSKLMPSRISPVFDEVYTESTLKRIGASEGKELKYPICVGTTFEENPDCFSFFPARLSNGEDTGFGRPVINTERFGLKRPGARTGAKSRDLEPGERVQDLWEGIAESVLEQGFILGTHADPLSVRDSLFKQPGVSANGRR